MDRFSKKAALNDIGNRIHAIQAEAINTYGIEFNVMNGWNQVVGKRIEVVVLYGKWDALHGLLDSWQ